VPDAGSGTSLTAAALAATYRNFDVVIERGDGKYRARVARFSGDEARAAFETPFKSDDFEVLADQLDRSRRMRKMVTPQLSLAKEMGGRLHGALFHDDIRESLSRARDDADREGCAGIRIRLHLAEAPDLAILPWEFLFDPDPRIGRFLALQEETPLVRYLDLPEKIRPLKTQLPIRVLGVVSNPADDRYPELDVEREWSQLKEALAQPIADGRLELLRLEKPTVSGLQDMLEATDANILHFIGHGRFDVDHQDGLLAFEGERGGVNEISAERLGTLLYNEKGLRLVVLNACEGGRASGTDPYAGMAQTLTRMRVPAVVAMQFEISDKAAIAFARQFYRGIALGHPVDAAITEARMAIYQQVSEVEWATPVLYMRTPNGAIFDLTETVTPAIRSPKSPETAPVPKTATPVAPAVIDVRRGLLPRGLPWLLAIGLLLVVGGFLGTRILPGIVGSPGGASPTASVAVTPRPTVPAAAGTMKVIETLSAGPHPDGVVVDEKTSRLYVVNGDVGQVRILDASTRKLIGTAQVPGQPVDIAADPILDRVYVTQYKTNSLAVLDGSGKTLATTSVGAGAFAIAIHPDTHRVYVVNQIGNNVSVIDPNSLKVVKTIAVGATPSDIAINPLTGRAYVANLGSRSLSVIDTITDSIIGSVSLDAAPARVAVVSTSDLILIANPDDNSVTIMSGQTQKAEKRIVVGKHPLAIRVDLPRLRAYVAVTDSGTIGVIDLNTRTLDHVVTVGAQPSRLAFATGSSQLYVTNWGSDTMSVIE
jgi:YVTN family beta-propeller protein